MTREEELATLIAQIGLERGVDAEQVADEMGRMALPRFIDAQGFRAALVTVLERQLRAQVERQIDAIRQRMGAAPAPATPDVPPILDRRPAVGPAPPAPQPAEAPTHPLASDLPDDATIYWTPDQAREARKEN